MTKKSGQPGNGLGHRNDWNGGVARFTATPNKKEQRRRDDARRKQKGWD